jgi:hypothetical protein
MLESLLALILGLISVVITFSIYAMISSLKNKVDKLSLFNESQKDTDIKQNEKDDIKVHKEDDNDNDEQDDQDGQDDKDEFIEKFEDIKYVSGSERCYKPSKSQLNSNFDRKILPTNIKGVNIDDPNYLDIDYATRQINEMDRRNPKYDSNFPFMEFETDYKL